MSLTYLLVEKCHCTYFFSSANCHWNTFSRRNVSDLLFSFAKVSLTYFFQPKCQGIIFFLQPNITDLFFVPKCDWTNFVFCSNMIDLYFRTKMSLTYFFSSQMSLTYFLLLPQNCHWPTYFGPTCQGIFHSVRYHWPTFSRQNATELILFHPLTIFFRADM